jgi:hypothetical protein
MAQLGIGRNGKERNVRRKAATKEDETVGVNGRGREARLFLRVVDKLL